VIPSYLLYLYKILLSFLLLISASISPLVLTTTTDPSSAATTSLSWANVHFEVIGQTGKRVWNFQGSGISNAQNLLITYTTDTPYNIKFEGVWYQER